jgi:hypothetical protein
MKIAFTLTLCFALFSTKSFSQITLSCDSFCVETIEIDSSGMLAVTIRNDNFGHVNYPNILVLDANGDTVAGDPTFTIFAHMGGTSYTYVVPTVLDSVPAGFTGTVLLFEEIWDTVCVLPYPCVVEQPNEVFEVTLDDAVIFPVPANDALYVRSPSAETISLFNARGVRIWKQRSSQEIERIGLTDFAPGMYYLQISGSDGRTVYRKVPVVH